MEHFWMFGLMSMKKRRDCVVVMNGSKTVDAWTAGLGRSSVLFVVYTCWYDDVSTEVDLSLGGLPSEHV